MALPTQKLVHTFGALADLGQEVTDSSDVSEMVLTSLHLVLGALAIRRGAILEHLAGEELLKLVAARGLDEGFPETLLIDEPANAALIGAGLSALSPEALAGANPQLSELFEQCKSAAGSFEIQLFVPMVVRAELVGVMLLGAKATDEAFTTEECDIIFSMVRHIGVGIHTHRLLE